MVSCVIVFFVNYPYSLTVHIHTASNWWKENISSKNELEICKKHRRNTFV